jgi:hypothetical protein
VVVDVSWKPPALGSLKINWDAGIDRDRGVVGIGIVVRNHEGSLIAALNCSLFANLDPTSAEAYATWNMACPLH